MTVLLRRTPTQTASQHSALLLVHEMVFCSLLMTLSAASHGGLSPQRRWKHAPCARAAKTTFKNLGTGGLSTQNLPHDVNTKMDTCHRDHNSRGSVDGWHRNNTTCGALQKEYRRHNFCAASNEHNNCPVRAMHDGGWGLHLHIGFIAQHARHDEVTSRWVVFRALVRAAHSFAKASTRTVEHGTRV